MFWKNSIFVILTIVLTSAIFSLTNGGGWTNFLVLAAAIAGLIIFQIKINKPINDLINDIAKINSESNNDHISTNSKINDLYNVKESFTNTTKLLQDKIYWYEQLLDAIPFPISVTDMDMNWTFINKPVVGIIGKERKDVIGKKMQCSNWNADICNTDRCGIAMLKKGESTSWFNQPGLDMDFQVDTSFLHDKNGNKIGHIEVVQDITETNRLKKRLEYGTNLLLKELEKFSSGDLTVEINDDTNDQVGKLLKGYVAAVSKVSKLLESVTETVAATASASTQISSSTEEMAVGSKEQNSKAAEVAAAIEEMTKTIAETAQNTSIAAEKSRDAGNIAEEGGKVVEETVIGMNQIAKVVKKSVLIVRELGKSSDQIGAIIQVIDEIADQTNLLALNAAIEAARAGEHGRGFAVVADEVRKLAERTTVATQEIADMIKKIQKDTSVAVESIELGTEEVEKGIVSAEKAGESLKSIISGTNEVVDVVSQVAVASEEQSTTSEQISRNIEGISNVIQESSIGLEQIARASEDLNQLTENLQNLISQFKVKSETSNYSVKQNGALIES